MIKQITKKIAFSVLICFASQSSFATKLDTISNWQINFNYETILKLNEWNKGYVLELSKDTLSETDLLGIKYSAGCLVCSDCITHLAIYDQNKNLVQYEDGKGAWAPIYISFRQILIHSEKTGQTIFDCYFLVGNKIDSKRATHVLRIQLI